jgi:predicted metallopeptidase
MKGQLYRVGIQIIEVWRIDVKANSESEAEAIAFTWDINKIRREGDHQSSETDYAETLEQIGNA